MWVCANEKGNAANKVNTTQLRVVRIKAPLTDKAVVAARLDMTSEMPIKKVTLADTANTSQS